MPVALPPIQSRILPSALTVSDSVLSCIGGTPLVRLDRLASAHGLRCNLLGKLEYFNAGGSVKDRIALRMVIEAEAEGRLVPGKSVMCVTRAFWIFLERFDDPLNCLLFYWL